MGTVEVEPTNAELRLYVMRHGKVLITKSDIILMLDRLEAAESHAEKLTQMLIKANDRTTFWKDSSEEAHTKMYAAEAIAGRG